MRETRSAALIVDPDPVTRRALQAVVARAGFVAATAGTPAEAIEKFHAAAPALVLLDFAHGPQLLRVFTRHRPAVPVIALAAAPDVRAAVEATRGGATEFLDKQAPVEELARVIEAVVAAGAAAGDRAEFFGRYAHLFAVSGAMRRLEPLLTQAAATGSPVVIEGETGVGKEVVARALHHLSPRAERPCLALSCATLPSDVLESELFGREPAPGTDAPPRPGRLERADGGTLVLDEVGGTPWAVQAKLAHVLQHGEFFRVGGLTPMGVDVRIVATTSRDLAALVSEHVFRADLYYRLNVLRLRVPPLRDRREEIPFLVDHLRERFARRLGCPPAELSADTREGLSAYAWPGNVRELENLVERFAVTGDEGALREALDGRPRGRALGAPAPVPPAEIGLREIARRAAREAEIVAVREVLERARWNRAEAARVLKISYKTLLRKVSQSGLSSRPGLKRPR
jgi:DNA-binding NtrC family response regulator